MRYLVGKWLTTTSDFPWPTFAINVVGALVLALLPALAVVRRSRPWTVALGPGLLGGFTTLSTYSEQTRALLDDGRAALAVAYLAGTLLACLLAVALASRLSTPGAQDELALEGGEE